MPPGLLSSVTRRLRPAVAPRPSDEAPASWATRTVRVLVAALALGIALAILHNTVAGRFPAVAALVGELGVLGLVTRLNRRERPELAAGLLATSVTILATGLMLLGYGMRDVASLMLTSSLVVCGLLLSPRALAGLAALTVACATLVIFADAHGLLLTSHGPFPWLRQSIDAAVIIGVSALGVGLVSSRLRASYESLAREREALRGSEERYRCLIDLAADAICVRAEDGRILEVNRRLAELTGCAAEQLLGRPAESLCDPADARLSPFAHRGPQHGETLVVEHDLRRADGSSVPVEVSSRHMPDGTYQCILRDVSERRKAEQDRLALEARLRQSQKMEAIGRLAGGIAHDFNNLLTAITGSLTLAMRDVPPQSRAERWLREVDNAAWRAADLTRQLLAFSREQANARRRIDLRSVVEGTRPMLARLIGEDVELRTTVPTEPCVVEADQGQLEQVLLNLAANARDAMPEGGRLELEVSLRTLGDEHAAAHPETRPGRYVELAVRDSGHGMTEDVRQRVFEPFFTTKPAGAGTGLGLSTVYGAVQQNQGSIEVDSAPGQGTVFRILLPQTGGDTAVASLPPPLTASRGTETILLVEDEAPVREVTTLQLDSLGYHVLACPGGAAALATAESHRGPLHLLMSDLVMPGMNGRELARRLAQARPGLKVLFTSGYGEEVAARQGVLEPGASFLEKPYTLAALARKVRDCLDRPPC